MTAAVPPVRSTAAFVAAFVLTGMVTTVLGPILPELLTAWHLTDGGGGALFSAQFTGSVTAGLVSGLVVGRIGDARTLAIGYALMSLGLLGISGGSHAWGVTGACLVGLGMGCVIPPTNLLIARERPERAAAALGGLNFAWGIGASAWPLIVSSVIRVAGLRPALVTLALLCAIASLRIGTLASPVRQPSGAGDRSATSLNGPYVLLLAALVFLYSGTEMAIGGWVAELSRRLPSEATASRAALVAAAFWGGLACGRGLVALSLKRRYEDHAVLAGLTLTATAVLLLATTNSQLTIAVAAALAGFGLGPVFPVTGATVSRSLPVHIAGPMLALGSLGSAVIPWLVGAISDASHSLAIGLGSLLVNLTILFLLHLRRRIVTRRLA